jgi:hypothetical protein
MKVAVADDGGFPSSDQTTRIGQWINSAYNEVVGMRGWSWIEATPAVVTLVASQQGYVLWGSAPVVPDFGGIIDVSIELSTAGARVKLIATDAQTFDRLSNHSRVAGVPSVYTVAGAAPASTSGTVTASGTQSLLLWPIPLATATNGTGAHVRYYRKTDGIQLSANGDIPIVPVQHHDVIVMLACARGLMANDQVNQAMAYRKLAEERIQTMLEEDDRARPIRDSERLGMVAPPQGDPRISAQRTSSRVYPPAEGN